MEPDRQLEIQLGHMCNNRCVFCVSGQRTALGEAGPTPAAPVIEKLREGRALGLRKITLLGGEPTLQPEFMTVVREAVALGYDDIVIFTNGVKTARAAFVDEVLATGGRFTWRLSFQGATLLAHERTTKKLGSFGRLRETLAVLHARRQRVTVNMCVVRSNYESIGEFPRLLVPYGVRQVHLDMVRPLDAGARTEDELRAMMPRYADLVPHLEKMIAGFPRGFDVNVGNLPYCVAPHLAPWIHHDGEATLTVAVDHDDALSDPWDKYAVKRRDKGRPASCAPCAMAPECSGVFETYARFHGTSELVPLRTRPAAAPVDWRIGACVQRVRARAPFGALAWEAMGFSDGGRRAAFAFRHPAGAGVEVRVACTGAGVAGSYALTTPASPVPPDLADAVRGVLAALRTPLTC